jgi:uncharacterized protein with PQ loop repeat
MSNTIGYITLNISFIVYLAFLLPQLMHNWRYRSTQCLSLTMHYVMCAAYMLDLMYGFGRHMQWQYQTVSLMGLFCLAIQHVQIYRYSGFNTQQRQWYFFSTVILFSILIGAVSALLFIRVSPAVWILAGGLSQTGWLIYVIPQIIKNYKIQSTMGISIHFVMMMIFLGLCDTVSAWVLGWDWPSKLGAPLSILIKVILLYQFYIYSAKTTAVSGSFETK